MSEIIRLWSGRKTFNIIVYAKNSTEESASRIYESESKALLRISEIEQILFIKSSFSMIIYNRKNDKVMVFNIITYKWY